MNGDLSRLLDELEAAHAKATPGEWSNPEYTSAVYGGDQAQLLRVASGVHRDDAALIVAAVNTAPVLIAALRRRDAALAAVRELHRPAEGSYGGLVCASCIGSDEEMVTWPCPTGAVLAAHEQNGEQS